MQVYKLKKKTLSLLANRDENVAQVPSPALHFPHVPLRADFVTPAPPFLPLCSSASLLLSTQPLHAAFLIFHGFWCPPPPPPSPLPPSWQLRQVSAEAAKRLLELAAEWERVRLPLVEDWREKKAELMRRKEGMQSKIARIKEMRGEMEALAGESSVRVCRWRRMFRA